MTIDTAPAPAPATSLFLVHVRTAPITVAGGFPLNPLHNVVRVMAESEHDARMLTAFAGEYVVVTAVDAFDPTRHGSGMLTMRTAIATADPSKGSGVACHHCGAELHLMSDAAFRHAIPGSFSADCA